MQDFFPSTEATWKTMLFRWSSVGLWQRFPDPWEGQMWFCQRVGCFWDPIHSSPGIWEIDIGCFWMLEHEENIHSSISFSPPSPWWMLRISHEWNISLASNYACPKSRKKTSKNQPPSPPKKLWSRRHPSPKRCSPSFLPGNPGQQKPSPLLGCPRKLGSKVRISGL